MAGNYIQPGETLTFTAPSGGVTSGNGYFIGALFCIATGTAIEGAEFEGKTNGVWTLPKLSAQAWTEGQKVYWDAGNNRCTTVSTDGALIGVAAEVAANPSGTGSVRLNGVAAALSEGPQGAIVDFASLTDTPATADALRDDFEAKYTAKLNAILAALRAAGIIVP